VHERDPPWFSRLNVVPAALFLAIQNKNQTWVVADALRHGVNRDASIKQGGRVQE
jgi:hypothetical protein